MKLQKAIYLTKETLRALQGGGEPIEESPASSYCARPCISVDSKIEVNCGYAEVGYLQSPNN